MSKQACFGWAIAVAAGFGLVACSPSDEPEESQASVSASSTDTSDEAEAEAESEADEDSAEADEDSTSELDLPPIGPTDLTVTIPPEAPEETGSRVVSEGEGETVAAGDVVLLAWEMYAHPTGEVVESTNDDFGGPVPVALGGGATPAAFEEAIIGQKIGSRLEVEFPAGMEDLPPQFDADQAYVLAVEIIELFEEQEVGAPPASTSADDSSDNSQADTTAPQASSNESETTVPETARPETTVPAAPRAGLYVSADGVLGATLPAGLPLPEKNTHEVVSVGDGPSLQEGDNVRLSYVMVSWGTGQVVKSTQADLGGPQSLVLGDLEIPRYLESAIFRQPVGSRLQVIYSPDLVDLPAGLDRDDAYVLAVDIIGAG